MESGTINIIPWNVRGSDIEGYSLMVWDAVASSWHSSNIRLESSYHIGTRMDSSWNG